MGINGSANAVVTFNQRDFALGNSTGNGATTNQELELMRRSNFALRLQPSLAGGVGAKLRNWRL